MIRAALLIAAAAALGFVIGKRDAEMAHRHCICFEED